MPGRLINVNFMMGAAMLIGLLASSARTYVRRSAPLAMTVLPLSKDSLIWLLIERRPPAIPDFETGTVLAVGAMAALGSTLAHGPVGAPARGESRDRARRWRVPTVVMCAAACAAGFALLAYLAVSRSDYFGKGRDPAMSAWRSVPLLAAARGRGPLLTAGNLFLVQLRTRRPVVLDGGTLDTLPYAVEAGPATARILRDVYGIDLFNPPQEARLRGTVPLETTRTVWSAYSRARWQHIAREFGARQVLTPGNWHLDLPVVSSSPELTLYEIPD